MTLIFRQVERRWRDDPLLNVLAAWATLFSDDQVWTDALRQLREGFGKAQRVAAEGVEAITLQRDLFAAAVGIPAAAAGELAGFAWPVEPCWRLRRARH